MASAFDVFISYKSEYLPWVEVLARNLERQGLSVWLDDWQRVAGRRVSQSLQAGLNEASAAILVVTPEAAQSGWVQSEYERMRQRQRQGDGFHCVPLILRATDGFAFLDELFAVDFQDVRTPELYRRRLHQVVCGLQGKPAGQGYALVGEIEMPPPLDRAPADGTVGTFDALLSDVARHRIAAVFMQEGADRLRPIESLLEATRRRFPRAELRHVVPPAGSDDHAQEYFARIGRLCGLGNAVSDASGLGSALAARLDGGSHYLLIVSHIENGPPVARRDFAAQLRIASDQYRNRLSLLFLGGEKLDELVFHSSYDISLLNTAMATAHDWPEPRPDDLLGDGAALDLTEAEAKLLIEATGGEARLIAECLRRRVGMRELSAASCRAVVAESPVVRQWFAPFATEQIGTQRVCRLLDQDDLGVFSRIRDIAVLRRLYWRGALRKIDGEDGVFRLGWRCSAIRDAGRRILQCDNC
jgi:hypothetical protein